MSESALSVTTLKEVHFFRESSTKCLLLFLLIFPILLASCNIDQEVEKGAQNIDLPTAYSGEIPCADCPGIVYTLILEKRQFTEIRRYRDRTPMTFTTRGLWNLNEDTLVLKMDDESIRSQLLFDHGSLVMLNRNGERIEGELAGNYRLDHRPEIGSIWVQHRSDYENGVTYKASGNEPFWAINIYQESRLLYSEPGDSLTFDSISIQPESEKRISVDAENKTASISLTMENRLCRDSMSGALFSYSSELIISKSTASPDTLTGCGSDLTELYSGE